MDFKKRLEEVAGNLGVEKSDIVTDLEKFYRLREAKEVESKKVTSYKFTNNILRIVPVGDIHLGHSNSNLEKLKAVAQYILETENCVTILMGDLSETATKVSVGLGMFEEDIHIPEQLELLYKVFKPLAEANKILGVTTGNHELRVAMLVGLNPMEMLAKKLGVPYLGYQGYIKTDVGDQTYHIMIHHGVGGGSSSGAKANSAEKLNKVAFADLYLSGHTHSKHFTEDLIYYIDNESEELVAKRRCYVACGSFLEYWGGYAEMKLLQPTPTGVVHIELRGDIKDIRVNI